MAETFLVYGPPGCGKTTYIVRQAQLALDHYGTGDAFSDDSPILFSSLTRAAAGELKMRGMDVAPDRIGTLHAHAFRALGKPKMATGKQLAEFNELCAPEHIVNGESDQPDRTLNAKRSSSGDKLLSRYAIYRAKLTPRELWDVNVQRFASEYETWKRSAGCLDFSDLIDEAHRSCDAAPGNPQILFQDEAQDSDRSQFRLLMKWANAPSCDKLIVVGDPDQNLYEWRGSEPEAFYELQDDPQKIRVLKQSYRVPRAIHGVACRIIARAKKRQVVEYLPRETDGKVVTIDRMLTTRSEAEWLVQHAWNNHLSDESAKATRQSAAGATLDEKNSASRIQGAKSSLKVMFLASCEYMLVPVMMALRARGIPYWNPFSPERGAFNPLHPSGDRRSAASRLLDYLRPSTALYGVDARLWTAGELAAWTEHVEAKGFLTRGWKARIEKLAEGAAGQMITVEDLVEMFAPEHFADACGLSLDWFEKRLLASKRKNYGFALTVAKKRGAGELLKTPRVACGTIHSVKGGEADVVYLAPDLSPQAFQAYRSHCPDPVHRMFYVGATRARETLVLCRRAAPGSAFYNW